MRRSIICGGRGAKPSYQIRDAFAALPTKYRLVATLALIEEESYENIAAAAGISVALVKVRVFRAVRMLRKRLAALNLPTGANA
jgi:DNA-directed RNA polymerase specialized sigma24 family protein